MRTLIRVWYYCLDYSQFSEYVAPYAHLVNDQPSKEMMRSIVARYRPEIRECYSRDVDALELVRIVTLGWDKDPEARISAASMVNRLKSLITRRHQRTL